MFFHDNKWVVISRGYWKNHPNGSYVFFLGPQKDALNKFSKSGKKNGETFWKQPFWEHENIGIL